MRHLAAFFSPESGERFHHVRLRQAPVGRFLQQPPSSNFSSLLDKSKTKSPKAKAKREVALRFSVFPWVAGTCSGSEPKLAITNTAPGRAFWDGGLQRAGRVALKFPNQMTSSAEQCFQFWRTSQRHQRNQAENLLYPLKHFVMIKSSSLLAVTENLFRQILIFFSCRF